MVKTASVSEIKRELLEISAEELLELCMRVIKYKKENKELMSYLLFEANDLSSYIQNIKNEMDESFLHINRTNLYFAKKNLRKILKTINKYIKYTTSKEAEVELLTYYCRKINTSGLKIDKSAALTNLYNNQIKKIRTVIGTLHDDLQYDYTKQLETLSHY